MALTKIEKGGYSFPVLKLLYVDGKTIKEVTNWLKEQGLEVSEDTVTAFKNKAKECTAEKLKQDEVFRDRLADFSVDTLEEMLKLMDEIKERMEGIPKNPKMASTWFHGADKRTKLIELITKLQGQFIHKIKVEKSETKTVNINIAVLVKKELERMIDEGKVDEVNGKLLVDFPELVEEVKKKKKKKKIEAYA